MLDVASIENSCLFDAISFGKLESLALSGLCTHSHVSLGLSTNFDGICPAIVVLVGSTTNIERCHRFMQLAIKILEISHPGAANIWRLGVSHDV